MFTLQYKLGTGNTHTHTLSILPNGFDIEKFLPKKRIPDVTPSY